MRTYSYTWCPVVVNGILERETGEVKAVSFQEAFEAVQGVAQSRGIDYLLLKLELVSL